jgi:kumamolisin
VHTRLYAAGTGKGFRDIVQGDNGAYKARTGWDPCTGLGSPDGEGLRKAL